MFTLKVFYASIFVKVTQMKMNGRNFQLLKETIKNSNV